LSISTKSDKLAKAHNSEGKFMKISTIAIFAGLLTFTASLSIAGPVVTGSASFLGGLNGSWSFQYTSDTPGLVLESIVLDLSPTDLKFDTAPGGFGSGSYKDVGGFGGTNTTTGLSGISATGLGLDGTTILTFSFTNFSSGSIFQFTSDVDHPDPTLLSLQNCGGKTGLALAACTLANVGRTATNDARLLAAQTVGPNQMAGARVAFHFAGDGYEEQIVNGAFQPFTFTLGNGLFASADVSTPEPASMATFGAGLIVLIALAGRRRRA
jgi:MYXO-CTERM domain-containing protein